MHSLVFQLMKPVNTFLPSLGKENNSPGEQCLKVLLSPYFLQILKADLIQSSPEAQLCCNMCMICFFAPFQASSQEDCVQVVALLALKGQKVAQNFLVCPNPGSVFIAYDI